MVYPDYVQAGKFDPTDQRIHNVIHIHRHDDVVRIRAGLFAELWETWRGQSSALAAVVAIMDGRVSEHIDVADDDTWIRARTQVKYQDGTGGDRPIYLSTGTATHTISRALPVW